MGTPLIRRRVASAIRVLWLKARGVRGGIRIEVGARCLIEYPSSVELLDGCRLRSGVVISGSPTPGLSVRVGRGVEVAEYSLIQAFGGSVRIGDRAYVGPHSLLYGHGGLSIGINALIAGHAVFIPADHDFSRLDIPINRQGLKLGRIEVGDDVWIGAGVTVTRGVTIGRGAVIGAGSVVTHDIPEYSIAFGVPARVARSRETSGKRA